ncbi:hypothetical protein BDZ89DRAFT_1124736, partial [Hymenopellis radicata]
MTAAERLLILPDEAVTTLLVEQPSGCFLNCEEVLVAPYDRKSREFNSGAGQEVLVALSANLYFVSLSEGGTLHFFLNITPPTPKKRRPRRGHDRPPHALRREYTRETIPSHEPTCSQHRTRTVTQEDAVSAAEQEDAKEEDTTTPTQRIPHDEHHHTQPDTTQTDDGHNRRNGHQHADSQRGRCGGEACHAVTGKYNGARPRDDASSFFGGPPTGTAGYNRGSFFHAGREEPLKGGDEEQGEGGFDIYADFNNAGPKYSSAFTGNQAHEYRPLAPSTPKLMEDTTSPSGVELVTVPALGPEWKKDELRDMTKAGRKEKKYETRK